MANVWKTSTGRYTFGSQPQPVAASSTVRSKYRPAPEEVKTDEQLDRTMLATTANLMYDPRVVRGITLGQPVQASNRENLNATRTSNMSRQQQQQREIQAEKARKIQTSQIRPALKTTQQIHSQIKVAPQRTEVPVQLYLVEQEETTRVNDAFAQTDKWVEEVAPTPFIPRMRGRNAASQVENERVFDYDLNVQPLLSVLVDKTLDQALKEASEEEELKALRRHRRALEAKFSVERAKEMVLEQAAQANWDQRNAKLAAARAIGEFQTQVGRKMAAAGVASQLFAGMDSATLAKLEQRGDLRDATEETVTSQVLPWLQNQVAVKLSERAAANSVLSHAVGEVTAALYTQSLGPQVAKEQAAAEEAALTRAAEIQAADEAAKRFADTKVSILVRIDFPRPAVLAPESPRVDNFLAPTAAGPFNVTLGTTVAQLEQLLRDYMDEQVLGGPVWIEVPDEEAMAARDARKNLGTDEAAREQLSRGDSEAEPDNDNDNDTRDNNNKNDSREKESNNAPSESDADDDEEIKEIKRKEKEAAEAEANKPIMKKIKKSLFPTADKLNWLLDCKPLQQSDTLATLFSKMPRVQAAAAQSTNPAYTSPTLAVPEAGDDDQSDEPPVDPTAPLALPPLFCHVEVPPLAPPPVPEPAESGVDAEQDASADANGDGGDGAAAGEENKTDEADAEEEQDDDDDEEEEEEEEEQ